MVRADPPPPVMVKNLDPSLTSFMAYKMRLYANAAIKIFMLRLEHVRTYQYICLV